MVVEWKCPEGHDGPWRYVEAIEVFREVVGTSADRLVVNGRWETDEGYNEGVPGSKYLECRGDNSGCLKRVPVPDTIQIDWS